MGALLGIPRDPSGNLGSMADGNLLADKVADKFLDFIAFVSVQRSPVLSDNLLSISLISGHQFHALSPVLAWFDFAELLPKLKHLLT